MSPAVSGRSVMAGSTRSARSVSAHLFSSGPIFNVGPKMPRRVMHVAHDSGAAQTRSRSIQRAPGTRWTSSFSIRSFLSSAVGTCFLLFLSSVQLDRVASVHPGKLVLKPVHQRQFDVTSRVVGVLQSQRLPPLDGAQPLVGAARLSV